MNAAGEGTVTMFIRCAENLEQLGPLDDAGVGERIGLFLVEINFPASLHRPNQRGRRVVSGGRYVISSTPTASMHCIGMTARET